MDTQILIGLLLTVLPVFELRGGLPVIVEWAVRNDVSVLPWFVIVLVLNVLVIFVIFAFLDFLHESFMGVKIYRSVVGRFLKRVDKKADRVMAKMEVWGYLALTLFVAVPLPGTGAWTGTLVAWALGLDRWKSIGAISLGVVIAGLIVLFTSLGFFGLI